MPLCGHSYCGIKDEPKAGTKRRSQNRPTGKRSSRATVESLSLVTSAATDLFYPCLSEVVCAIYKMCESAKRLGSAPAPGAVFRAHAENPRTLEYIKRPCQPRTHHGGMRGASRDARGGRAPRTIFIHVICVHPWLKQVTLRRLLCCF